MLTSGGEAAPSGLSGALMAPSYHQGGMRPQTQATDQIIGDPSVQPTRSTPRLRTVAIVPAFNEAGSIGDVIREVQQVDPELEVVVVDDDSTDRTAAAAA